MSDERGPAAIESDKYRTTREALAKDPIIQAMAADMPAAMLPKVINRHGSPTWAFMQTCLDEYHNRGGKIDTHIGGPAEVIVKLVLGERP